MNPFDLLPIEVVYKIFDMVDKEEDKIYKDKIYKQAYDNVIFELNSNIKELEFLFDEYAKIPYIFHKEIFSSLKINLIDMRHVFQEMEYQNFLFDEFGKQ